ncbi:Sua5/YciO/YrdC/YwlC family protein [Cellulomonas gilvus ATCC 13127]|uniref:Sua5/YciO/YrdC/YwlC family protein n=2 Tax=Cellulomonadaceae TaxID=85016 RepID=F8A2S5_CELGA|nr:Sua5/YciO/YrdC/YwlC family protein [Cellulomonas gilvus ATCC 13127]
MGTRRYGDGMARYLDVHPHDPQPRLISQAVEVLRGGGVIAYPTDSCYALGTTMGSHDGAERIRRLRHLDDRHHFTLVCADFAQLGQLVHLDNAAFRAIKSATPGPYTFILQATPEVPRRLAHAKKRSVGVRIPDHPVAAAIVRELGEPILSSSLLMPGHEWPMTEGWQIREELDHDLDAVVDAGDCGTTPTTVVDWTSGSPEVVREGAGDPDRFQ